MSDSAWDPFLQLQERIREVLDPLGLTFEGWAINPDAKAAQMVVTIRTDEAFKSPEQRETDKAIEDMEIAFKVDKDKAKAEETRQNLLKMSRRGIFDEDDAPGE